MVERPRSPSLLWLFLAAVLLALPAGCGPAESTEPATQRRRPRVEEEQTPPRKTKPLRVEEEEDTPVRTTKKIVVDDEEPPQTGRQR